MYCIKCIKWSSMYLVLRFLVQLGKLATKWEKCGLQSCHEQQRSDCLEQLWSLSYSVEVKYGPWRRSWRKVSMDATSECCELPWMSTGNSIWTTRSYTGVSKSYWNYPCKKIKISRPLCKSQWRQWRDCFKSAALGTPTWSPKSR